MKALSWKPILSNLTEARGELLSTYERLYFLEFGELPEDCRWIGETSDYIAYMQKQEKVNPFDETALFFRLEHAYHHLNWAWNCRRTEEEKVWKSSDRAAARWTRFPQTQEFVDLWPEGRSIKEHVDDLSRRKVNYSILQVMINMAKRKLEILCYLVAKELGDERERPKGLNPEIGLKPLTEKEFFRYMHRIYAQLNTAWNSRADKTFVTGKSAIARRERFSSIFATGSWNMWRQS